MIDFIIIAVAFLWLVAASIQDIRRREVANFLSFSLLTIALFLRILDSILARTWKPLFFTLLMLVIFIVIANMLYYGKIFAGGDAKLLIALSACLAITPSFVPLLNTKSFFEIPLIFSFLINALFIGGVYGLVFSVTLAVKNRKSFVRKIKELGKKTSRILRVCIVLASLSLILGVVFQSPVIMLVPIALISTPYLFLFVKAVEEAALIKIVPAGKLTEGDWVVDKVKVGRKTIKPCVEGLTKQEVALLKKHNKRVKVKYGIPFVPVYLIAFIVSLLVENIFSFYP